MTPRLKNCLELQQVLHRGELWSETGLLGGQGWSRVGYTLRQGLGGHSRSEELVNVIIGCVHLVYKYSAAMSFFMRKFPTCMKSLDLSYGAHSLEYRILHPLTLPLERVRQTGLAGRDCWRSHAGVMGKSTPAEHQTIAPYPSPTRVTVSPLVFPWKLEHVPGRLSRLRVQRSMLTPFLAPPTIV